jgi:hypothetical protein
MTQQVIRFPYLVNFYDLNTEVVAGIPVEDTKQAQFVERLWGFREGDSSHVFKREFQQNVQFLCRIKFLEWNIEEGRNILRKRLWVFNHELAEFMGFWWWQWAKNTHGWEEGSRFSTEIYPKGRYHGPPFLLATPVSSVKKKRQNVEERQVVAKIRKQNAPLLEKLGKEVLPF